MFQSGLVRYLLVVIVLAKPRSPTFEANGIKRCHPRRHAALRAHTRSKFAPQTWKVFAACDQRCSRFIRESPTHNSAGNLAHGGILVHQEWQTRKTARAKL